MYWAFGRAGYSTFKEDPPALVGRALHAGQAAWAMGDTNAHGRGIETLEQEWAQYMGGEVASGLWSLEGLRALYSKVYAAGEAWRTKTEEVERLAKAEVKLAECRIDLVTERGEAFVITDYKYKHDLDQRWMQKELVETGRSHQLRHYAWRVQEAYQRPVIAVRKVLMIAGPKTRWVEHEVPITAGVLDHWRIGAEAKWAAMTAMSNETLPLYRREEACEMYGGCTFAPGCWDLDVTDPADPRLAQLFRKGL